jgi:outer membrane immunogenic protein
MKRLFEIAALAAAAAFVWANSANAADMPLKAPPPPPPPTWTGTYIGINGGYAWATTNHTDVFGVTTGDFNQRGGFAGVTYGGNWQMGHFVLGFESDYDWADINGTLVTAGPPLGLCSIAGGTTCFTKIKEFSTERMRAGYDVDGWLLFGTVGAGFARVSAGQNPCGLVAVGPGVGGGNSCGERWRAGWVGGGGVEKMFLPHWSAKIEYLHFDLGNSINYMPTAIAGGSAVKVRESGDMIKAGINYQFDLFSFLHF